jgi:hypothetical protein
MHDRALFEEKFVLGLIPDTHANDISGQEVRRELDSTEIKTQAGTEGTRKGGLSDPGHILNQDM